ncbi:MAG: FecR family protein, partial [Phenylobacterium sp.]
VLKRPTITAQALRDFDVWKRNAANAEAFAEIKRTYATEDRLASDPLIQAATREALSARPARPAAARTAGGWRGPFSLAVASVLVLGGAGALYVAQSRPAFSTDVGEQRMEVLKDGSRVRLNTDSKVRIRFSQGQRHVTLDRGEAFFEVAHDASRPFIVESAGAQVRALGTKFDVRHDPGAVQVTLLEGRVEVTQTGRPATARLAPNQALTVTAAGISAPRAAAAAEAAGWTTGRLTFRSVPVSAAIDEMNRYSRRKIVLTSADGVAAEPVSGVFEPGDTATFVAALETVFDLQVADQTANEIRLARKATPGG